MSKKVYNVSVFFDLHGVSCPGVWLCPKGKILVKVSLFGVSEVTKQVCPSFPMRFNERFHFQKTFRSAYSLFDLHVRLRNALIKLELIQYPLARADFVILAVFCSPLSDILYPCPDLKPFESLADVDLLFCPCKIFPGIIAPKAEVSTKITIKELKEGVRGAKMNPTTVQSQKVKKRLGKNEKIIRQKGVCHTQYNLHCKCYSRPGECNFKGPPNCLIRSKSITSVSSQDVTTNNSNNNFVTSEDMLGKSKSQEKFVNLEEFSEDFVQKRSDEDVVSRMCICKHKNGAQSQVQFRNFTMPNNRHKVLENENVKGKDKEKIEMENLLGRNKKASSKCNVCSCSFCNKYENYFIHRALEHSRGHLNKYVQKSSDNQPNFTNVTESPDYNRCFCNKDKKDYIYGDTDLDYNPFKGKDIYTRSEESNLESTKDENPENCCVCKGPIINENRLNETKKIQEKIENEGIQCPVCKCPIVFGKTNIAGYKSKTQRDDFNNHIEKYCAQLNADSNKEKTTSRYQARLYTRNPSTLHKKNTKKKWDFTEVNKEGGGYWEIATSDKNKK